MIPSIDDNPQFPSLLGNLSLNRTIHAGGIIHWQMDDEKAVKGEWNNDIYKCY